MIALELPNYDTFKPHLLKLLEEDATFKYTLIEVLFKDMPTTVLEQHKRWMADEKTALAKKHAIKPEVVRCLQDLFKDEPSAEEIIKMSKNHHHPLSINRNSRLMALSLISLALSINAEYREIP